MVGTPTVTRTSAWVPEGTCVSSQVPQSFCFFLIYTWFEERQSVRVGSSCLACFRVRSRDLGPKGTRVLGSPKDGSYSTQTRVLRGRGTGDPTPSRWTQWGLQVVEDL